MSNAQPLKGHRKFWRVKDSCLTECVIMFTGISRRVPRVAGSSFIIIWSFLQACNTSKIYPCRERNGSKGLSSLGLCMYCRPMVQYNIPRGYLGTQVKISANTQADKQGVNSIIIIFFLFHLSNNAGSSSYNSACSFV